MVICDYNLPGSENGLKLLAEIKKLNPSSKLILISGLIDSGRAAQVKIQGLVDEYFEKDIDLSDKLIREATEAITRAESNTNWKSVAQTHISSIKIEQKSITEIDELLRKDVGRKRIV